MMLDQDKVRFAVERGIGKLRALQDAEGFWLAEWRSLGLSLGYGISLIAAGHDPEEERLQDICNDLELYARSDGGFGHCESAASNPGTTHDVLLFLKRCRPQSSLIGRAERYLARYRVPPQPVMLLTRWILDPAARPQILATKPPSAVLRHFGARHVFPILARRLVTEKSRSPHAPGWFAQRVMWPVSSWCHWPDPAELSTRPVDTLVLPPPAALPHYASFLALQLRARGLPLSDGVAQTRRYVEPYLDRYLYSDKEPYYLLFAAPMLECLDALGRHSDVRGLRDALDRVEYRSGGWIRTTMVGTNILETGLTVQCLLENGVRPDEPMIQRACEFLHEARAPEGVWSWSWRRSNGPQGHRDLDSDDSGSALLALASAGSPLSVARREEVIARLLAFQRSDGALATMDPRVWITSQTTPSNNARALQALVALGVPKSDPRVESALRWLIAQQKPDGSWFDFWIVGKMYGTALALDALVGLGHRAVGHPDVERALNFIIRTQNADGGWGFDWYDRRTVTSVVEHTAMAVYALCTFSRPAARPMSAIEAGARWLIARQAKDGSWPASYTCNYNGWEGYTSSHFSLVFSMRALASFQAACTQYVPTAPQLVRSLRLLEKQRRQHSSTNG